VDAEWRLRRRRFGVRAAIRVRRVPHLIASFTIAPEDRDQITRLTERVGCSRSAVVRTAIRRLAVAGTNETEPPRRHRDGSRKSLTRSDDAEPTAPA
jgi:hypothetical protein